MVRLTNQVHEMELSNVVASAVLSSSSDSPGGPNNPGSTGPLPLPHPRPPPMMATSNGISFDSDRFEFREFVAVACQTSDKEDEDLQVSLSERESNFFVREVLFSHLLVWAQKGCNSC